MTKTNKRTVLALLAALASLGAAAQTAPSTAVAAIPTIDAVDAVDAAFPVGPVALADAGSSNAAAAAAPADAPGDAPAFTMPRVGLHLGSHHWPARKGRMRYNNENPGVYFRWQNGVTVGTYRNSEYRQSTYAGWTWARSDCGAAVTLGIITGYRQGTIPMAVPSLCFLGHVRFTYIPRVEPKGTSVLHLSLEF